MTLLRIFYTFALLTIAIPSFSAEIQWKQQLYSHYAENESLNSILKDLMYGEAISVSVSDKANVEINFNLENLPPAEALQRLANVYQFIWYYYGQVLYVYDMSEIQTATLKLVHQSPQSFTNTIKEMEIYDEKFSWYQSNRSKIIRFTGPKRLVELVMETATILDTDEPKPSSQFVYTWKDKKGREHFSSYPPVDSSIKHRLYSVISGEMIKPSNKK